MSTTSESPKTAPSAMVRRRGALVIPPRRGSQRGLWYGATFVLLGGAAAAFAFSRDSQQQLHNNMVLHQVERGTLSVEVTDRGNLESAKNIEHACEVEGSTGGGTTILWIIEEGKRVKKGDLLVELDSSNLADSEKTQSIAYQNALATHARAKADVETAEKALKEYVQGTFVQEKKTFEADLTVAEENLRRAQENVRFTDQLYRKGFVNKLDLEAAEFGVRNQEFLVDKAQTALDVLLNVTKDKMLTEFRGDLEAKSRILVAEQTKVDQEKARLDKIVAQLDKCKIYAKGNGMVVYYKAPGRWGRQEDQIQEGSVVRERQKIIVLPDLENMHVRMLVHESKIDWVRAGQPTKIRVDAFADRVLDGHVRRVATTPEQGNWFEQDKRNYPVLVTIDGARKEKEGLKPGMTAQTTVLVDRLTDVLTVPLQCIYTIGRNQYVSVVMPDGTIEERRAVGLGRNNDNVAEVLKGLKEGEQVVQSPVETLGLSTETAGETDPPEGEFTDDDGNAAKESGAMEKSDSATDGTASSKTDSARSRQSGGRSRNLNLMANDKDGDGKVSLEEAPESMQSWFGQIDTNGDGFIDAAENAALRKRMQQYRQQQDQGGSPGGGPSGP